MRTRNKFLIASVSVLAIGIVLGSAFVFALAQPPKDSIGLHGTINVWVTQNGQTKQVVKDQNDLVMNFAYDYLICKLFNETNACTLTAGYFGDTSGATNICKYRDASGTLVDTGTAGFYGKDLCSLTAIGLSTQTSGNPIQGSFACPSMLTGSGMAPALATMQHFGQSPQVILTANWVNGGTGSVTVGYVCLLPYNDAAAGTVLSTSGTNNAALLQDLLSSSVSVAPGAGITIQWTINFA